MNIFEAITQDHHIQRKTGEQLLETTGDSEQRDQLYRQFKAELEAHAEAEERYFYVPLIKLDSTQEAARHGIAEHHELDELIEKLEATDYSSSAWLNHAKALVHKVNHHITEEEQDYFPMVREVLSEDRAQQLGDEYLAAMLKSRRDR